MIADVAEFADEIEGEEPNFQSIEVSLPESVSPDVQSYSSSSFEVRSWENELLIPFNLAAAEPTWTSVPLLGPLELHILRQMQRLHISWKWRSHGVLAPSWECRIRAFRLFQWLLHEHSLVPGSVDASIEGGITLTYRHYFSNTVMILEVYNGLDISGVVSTGKEILYSEDIVDTQVHSIVEIFRSGESPFAYSRQAALTG